MAIAKRGSVTVADILGTTSWPVAKPTGVLSGDVCYVAASTSVGFATWTPPTGFTLIKDQTDGNNSRVIVWRRVCDGSEGATFTATAAGGNPSGSIACIALSGVDNTTPEDVAATSNQQNTVLTNPAQTSLTTVTDHALVLGFFGLTNAGAGASGTAGSSATEELDHYYATADIFLYIESLDLTPAGAKALTFTCSNGGDGVRAWEEVQVAVRPASGVTPKTLSASQTQTVSTPRTIGKVLVA